MARSFSKAQLVKLQKSFSSKLRSIIFLYIFCFRKLAAKEENGLSFLEGNHHFFVNDPDVAAEHICDFITR